MNSAPLLRFWLSDQAADDPRWRPVGPGSGGGSWPHCHLRRLWGLRGRPARSGGKEVTSTTHRIWILIHVACEEKWTGQSLARLSGFQPSASHLKTSSLLLLFLKCLFGTNMKFCLNKSVQFLEVQPRGRFIILIWFYATISPVWVPGNKLIWSTDREWKELMFHGALLPSQPLVESIGNAACSILVFTFFCVCVFVPCSWTRCRRPSSSRGPTPTLFALWRKF